MIGRPEHQTPAVPAAGMALRAGLGIGYCQIPAGRRDPELVPVLPGLILARIGIWLATHEDPRATRRIRVLLDHLAGELTHYVADSQGAGEKVSSTA